MAVKILYRISNEYNRLSQNGKSYLTTKVSLCRRASSCRVYMILLLIRMDMYKHITILLGQKAHLYG